MPNINDEMKSTADYAINAAKQRFKLELDFSDQSLIRLEKILEQIYWGFSNHPKDEGEGGVIYSTAAIWGSYLGEYMRLKWDGNWIQKGSDRLVSISNIEFSPINFVNQKITSHPEFSVDNYLNETTRILNTLAINPKEEQKQTDKISPPKKPIPIKPSKKAATFDKRLLFTIAAIGGILLVIAACIIGYSIIKTGGVSAFGLIAPATISNTDVPIQNTLVTATSDSTNTQEPTETQLSSYTPNPSITPHPSFTPSLTYTQIATLTPTETQKPLIPTQTRTPRKSPTNTPKPPPPQPTSTATERPVPTATQPPPVKIQSCDINPSTVPAGSLTTLTFTAHFSAPGYGFDTVIFSPGNLPGQAGCGATDDNGDSVASCDGNSGLLPDSTTVTVTFISSVGNCTATYRSQ